MRLPMAIAYQERNDARGIDMLLEQCSFTKDGRVKFHIIGITCSNMFMGGE
jgi:hypothetical protein